MLHSFGVTQNKAIAIFVGSEMKNYFDHINREIGKELVENLTEHLNQYVLSRYL